MRLGPAIASSSLLAGRFVRPLSSSCALDSIGTQAESALLAIGRGARLITGAVVTKFF